MDVSCSWSFGRPGIGQQLMLLLGRLSSSAATSEAGDVDDQDGGVVVEDVAASQLDDELQGRTCLKDADRPSAARLAKRLYYLDGFRMTDVSPHLSKKSVKLTSFSDGSWGVGFIRFCHTILAPPLITP